VFRRYYEARLYNIGPFASRPVDQFGIVATHSIFSDDARAFYLGKGVYPPRSDTSSLTFNYAYKMAPGSWLVSGLTYTDHPSFIYEPGQGHALNLFVSTVVNF
jgi:hypothetical protein